MEFRKYSGNANTTTKKRKIFVAPSILSADFSRLGEEIKSAERGGADLIHFDVMDGHFVPNISFGIPVLESLKGKVNLPFDVHLMISEPERYIDDFVKAGADIITFHIEATPHAHRTADLIKSKGKKVGIAINPSTPLSAVEEMFPYIDILLVMSVNPGFGGQKFIPLSLSKVKKADAMRREGGFGFLIEVDGGLNAENSPSVAEAGADILVFGSFTFRGNPEENVKQIKNILGEKI